MKLCHVKPSDQCEIKLMRLFSVLIVDSHADSNTHARVLMWLDGGQNINSQSIKHLEHQPTRLIMPNKCFWFHMEMMETD